MVKFARIQPQPGYPGGLWQGWKGENWKGYCFDIHAYFPTFSDPDILLATDPIGAGKFRVDYNDASRDFWDIVPQLKPVAVIAVTRGGFGWKFEEETRNLKNLGPLLDWRDVWSRWKGPGAPPYGPGSPHRQIIGGSAADPSPYKSQPPVTHACPGIASSSSLSSGSSSVGIALGAPDSTRPACTMRLSKLGYDNWRIIAEVAAVGGLNVYKDNAAAGNGEGAGKFVSEWIGYLANWYGDVKDSAPHDEKCPIRGSIHVSENYTVSKATLAMDATLESVCKKLKSLGYP